MRYEPKVTIIIPVYNGSNFLSQAIDAAISQTYKNIEIIVVNDGSTDQGMSEKIALSYGEKVRYFYKDNGGVSSALNFALERMSGEWFSWLSHDDLYYPDKIEKQICFINSLPSNTDINKIVVHTATESIDKNGKVIKIPSYKDVKIKEDTLETIIGNVFNYRLSGCSFLLPYSCYKDIGGFREDIRTVSDVEYWYRLLFSNYQFYCMKDDVLVKNRSHGKQVGKKKVSLFEKELNEFHISLVDKMMCHNEFKSKSNIERLYYGLVKRGMKDAAEYTREKYLEKNFKLLMMTSYYYTLGKMRSIVRYIYRKINVK